MEKLYVCAEPECRNYFVATDDKEYTCDICGAPMLKTKIPVAQFMTLSDKQKQNFMNMLTKNIEKYIDSSSQKGNLQKMNSDEIVSQPNITRQKETNNVIAKWIFSFGCISLCVVILFGLFGLNSRWNRYPEFWLYFISGTFFTLFLFGFYKIIQLLQTIADRLVHDDTAKK